jgi:hypothetical protein
MIDPNNPPIHSIVRKKSPTKYEPNINYINKNITNISRR